MSDCDRHSDELLDTRSPTALSPTLTAHLAACPDCRAQADQHFALVAKMDTIKLAPPPGTFAAITARLEAPTPGFFERWFGSWQLPALALASACAALMFVSSHREGLPYRAGGSFSVAAHPQSATGQLALGSTKCVVNADSWVELKPDPSSQLRISGPARFDLLARNRLRIQSGTALVDLSPQPAGYSIEVEGGQFRVIGTKFTLDVNPEGTRIKLEHGTVQIDPRQGEPRRLEAGGEAFLYSTGSLRSPEPTVPPPPTPEPPPPTREAPRASLPPPPTPASPPSIRAVRPGGRATGGF